MWRAVWWTLAHNVLVHPLVGIVEAAQIVVEAAHDFTARRMRAGARG